jgi:hypothetical protein
LEFGGDAESLAAMCLSISAWRFAASKKINNRS